MTPRARPRRPGVILLSVLVIIAIAALVGTSTMYVAEGERSGSALSVDRTQARSLAWSGVQAALAELADQREALLSGLAPELTPEWTLYTDDLGRRGVVRLAGVGPDGETAVSELNKLDVNTATEEMLGAAPGVGEALAKAIVKERATAPFASVEDLARVKGVTAERLHGVPEEGREEADASGARGADGAGEPPLVDVLTVFAFDANVQSGLGDRGGVHRGVLRINLNTTWSDELARAVADRFGADAVKGVEDVFKAGAAFKKDGDIVARLRDMGAPPDSWGVFLDAFTTCADPFVIGRVDLTSAPAEVLACVPGLDAQSAADIVAARDGLDEASRLDPAWPAARKIVPPEKYQQVIDHVCTRSLVWRVRVESGVLPPDAEDGAELGGRVVLDAVLDVSSERARVAYLRDVTLLPTSLAMERMFAAADEDSSEGGEEEAPADDPGTEAVTGGTSGSAGGSGAADKEGDKKSAPEPSADPSEAPKAKASDAGPVETQPAPPRPAPPEPQDRRVGRWTAGGKA